MDLQTPAGGKGVWCNTRRGSFCFKILTNCSVLWYNSRCLWWRQNLNSSECWVLPYCVCWRLHIVPEPSYEVPVCTSCLVCCTVRSGTRWNTCCWHSDLLDGCWRAHCSLFRALAYIRPDLPLFTLLAAWFCEGREFETRWGELIFFSIFLILPASLCPGVYLASNRNEYQSRKIMFLASGALLVDPQILIIPY
jgi:hypothetical protein